MIALFENKGWCYLKASWKLVFRSALKEQQLIIYILFVYFVYLDVITYSLDSINSCSINDATLGAVRAIMLACLAESWQESTKLITWSITWPLMLKSYPSNPCNPWSVKTKNAKQFWAKKYILLDFSWKIERKYLSLQPKVDYNILLWI